MKDSAKRINRRNFLKKLGAAGVGSVLTGKNIFADMNEPDVKEDSLHKMQVELEYGSGKVNLNLPEKQVMGVYMPAGGESVGDISEAVKASLRKPIGAKPLDQIVKPADKVVIVVDDVTRDVPNAELLLPVVDELHNAGVTDENITLIAALGLHRKMKQDELDAALGPLKGKIKTVNHDCEKNLQTIGKTSLGTEVYLNKTFLEADVKILTGDVEYHQFCGYGGGAKSVFPGLGDGQSITLSHSRMELEGTGAGRLKGNPVREEIDEIGRKVGVDFIVNVVINSDKKVCGVFAGDVYKAFVAGVKVCDKIYSVEVPKETDVVIASAGGFPRDIVLYQAQKAVEAARRIVKNGGKIILFAECREGHGSELAYQWACEATKPEDIVVRLRKKFVMGGHKAYQLARAAQWADIYIYSSMDPVMVRKFFLHPLASVDEIYPLIGKTDKIAVLPQATTTLARLKGSKETRFLS
jgi:nickel-dependent lactate racemase